VGSDDFARVINLHHPKHKKKQKFLDASSIFLKANAYEKIDMLRQH
jgi:hypothetical protein